ncbi:hypothetical protein [Gordonia sp. NPDC003376]
MSGDILGGYVRASKSVRAACGVADQVFSSASNGLILFALAVVADSRDFGRIALLFTLIATAVGVLRGGLGTPLLLSANESDEDVRRHGAYAVGTAAIIGAVVALAVVACGFVAGVVAESVVLGLAIPLVLMEDVLRYVAITLGRNESAALWDGLWFAGSLSFLVLAWGAPSWLTSMSLVLGWCLLAAVALAGLALNLGLAPRFRGIRSELWESRWDRARYGIDSGLEQLTVFLMLALCAMVIDSEASAALRGATAILAPLAILASAIPLLVIPSSARTGRRPVETWRVLVRVATGTSILALTSGIILHFVPEFVGSFLLGRTFAPAQSVVLLISFEYALGAWIAVVATYLKSQNRSAEALLLKGCYVSIALLAIGIGLIFTKTAFGVAAVYCSVTAAMAVASLAWFMPWRPPQPPGRHRRDGRRGGVHSFEVNDTNAFHEGSRTKEVVGG